MRPIVLVILALIIGIAATDFAEGRRRLRRAPVTEAMLNGTYQERAQAEADYMAANNYAGHVGKCIATFEGVGYSATSANCATCVPGRRNGGLALVADAVAQSTSGRYYRVRAWGANQVSPDQTSYLVQSQKTVTPDQVASTATEAKDDARPRGLLRRWVAARRARATARRACRG